MSKGEFQVRDPNQLQALASMARLEVVDWLSSFGPATIAEVAEGLGRPADALYYHVRHLQKVGLLVGLPARKEGRHVSARFDVVGRPLVIRQGKLLPDQLAKTVGSGLRMSLRDLSAAMKDKQSASAKGRTDRRNAWGGRVKGWLSKSDTDRINGMLDEIRKVLEHGKRRRGAVMQSFAFVFAPVRKPNRKRENRR